jgi:hypothetical protein
MARGLYMYMVLRMSTTSFMRMRTSKPGNDNPCTRPRDVLSKGAITLTHFSIWSSKNFDLREQWIPVDFRGNCDGDLDQLRSQNMAFIRVRCAIGVNNTSPLIEVQIEELNRRSHIGGDGKSILYRMKRDKSP